MLIRDPNARWVNSDDDHKSHEADEDLEVTPRHTYFWDMLKLNYGIGVINDEIDLIGVLCLTSINYTPIISACYDYDYGCGWEADNGGWKRRRTMDGAAGATPPTCGACVL